MEESTDGKARIDKGSRGAGVVIRGGYLACRVHPGGQEGPPPPTQIPSSAQTGTPDPTTPVKCLEISVNPASVRELLAGPGREAASCLQVLCVSELQLSKLPLFNSPVSCTTHTHSLIKKP